MTELLNKIIGNIEEAIEAAHGEGYKKAITNLNRIQQSELDAVRKDERKRLAEELMVRTSDLDGVKIIAQYDLLKLVEELRHAAT